MRSVKVNCVHLRLDPAHQIIEVIAKGIDFKISVINSLGTRRFTIMSRENIIAFTLEALKYAQSGETKVALIAPDWVKAALARKGRFLSRPSPRLPIPVPSWRRSLA